LGYLTANSYRLRVAMLNNSTNEYAYDAATRLISVNNTQTSTLSTFAYNGLGDRVSQTVNGVATNYTLDTSASPSTSLRT
jgi:YD repeat-containing protein